MILLGDEPQMQARFGSYGGSANLDSRLVHQMELLGDVGHVESPFAPFRDNISFGA
jgi:hypothetical protein